MQDTKKEFAILFSRIPLLLTGIFLLAFPLLFSVDMTEAFLLPKHFLLAAIISVAMISLALQILIERKMYLRSTPFDLPVLLFTIVILVSAFLSVNRYDSLISAVPFLYAALLYYIIVNTVRGEKALLFIIGCLTVGATAASLLSIFSFFQIYILPFSYVRTSYFSSVGTLLDQALYLAIVLPISGYFALQLISSLRAKISTNTNQTTNKMIDALSIKNVLFSVAFLIILGGFALTVFYLFTSQRPLILPLGHGFQIAFAAISQDAGRMLKSFLFGSGYGTFLSDFMRFKQPAYNASTDLWAVTFIRSSSFILELLATTGMLGLLSFLFIIFKVVRERILFLPLVLVIVAAFILPFSPLVITLFFAILGVFVVVRAQSHAPKYEEIEIHLTASQVGDTISQNVGHGKKYVTIVPGLFMILLIAGLAVTGYYTALFGISDMTFQKSLIAASQNNGSQTYDLQRAAIQTFPYRDVYHRVFSQTNIALANALAQQTPAGSSPSAQVQQNVLTLIQQSINTGRAATTISPYTAQNWNNLSSIYRALIGFGQNADQFALVTGQQAAALDPNDPQQYVNIGGIYYQLAQWDESIRQFQIAIQLKSDYANAYYNVGHALESKQDVNQALAAYEIVRSLVTKDPATVKSITAEIDALKAKISNTQVAGAATTPTETAPAAQGEPLNINKPANQLPTRIPPAKIEGVSITPIPTISKEPTTSPTVTTAPSLTPAQ